MMFPNDYYSISISLYRLKKNTLKKKTQWPTENFVWVLTNILCIN